ncbi:hypothetical protein HG536_0A03530 [Torulaspora globosa]|uniref:Vacuolar-sorting protein SNF7 n=1 Tax=Torulaspora globosa TaxID=48254 RepID=A0A7G3ZAJ9_9SACH|nr:uncharacterized protein HG536_0A03530 [Torulaspora globosa]QLL30535.1 hypothetical protein HG536_0A03530 [Torulaspora globosa]
MLSYFFGGSSGGGKNKDLPKLAIVELREQINLLTKKQSHLQTQILKQENDARAFLAKNNKNLAKNSLKKKKIYEGQLVKLEGQMETLEQQLFSIESANLNLETMRAMKQGAKAMKSMHNGLDLDKVDETMEEIREQVELGEEISDAISRPMYTGANEVDEEELDEELDMLAQEAALSEARQTSGAQSVSLPSAPREKIQSSEKQEPRRTEPVQEQEEEEEDEDERALRELQAEMGL